MGNGATKEEQLYQAVQNGNHNSVKALRRDGASLEYVDKEGRTPLVLACTRGDLFEMVLTLLNLGANIKAYRPGTYGGFPLHHAAKRGLDKTVLLLLSRGADPLAVNDDSLTPLDMARNRGHVSVVRMIEDHICLFSGVLREMAGPGFLEALAPQWVTKKIWVVVLPTETNPRRSAKFELVIYQSPKVPLPRTIILLSKAEVEEPKLSSPDPVLMVTDRNTKTKYKFLAETEGDQAQLKRLYKACKGIPQTVAGAGVPGMPPQAVLQGLSALTRPMGPHHPPAAFNQEPPDARTPPGRGPSPGKLKSPAGAAPEDVALKMAIDASLRTASAEGVPFGEYRDGDDRHGPAAGPSRAATSDVDPAERREPAPVPPAPPSAPSLPAEYYPSRDTSPARPDSAVTTGALPVEEKKSQCVVCWDAPAQGVCIPCGHLAGCMECLSEIEAKKWGCPVCRAPIQQVIKVYAV